MRAEFVKAIDRVLEAESKAVLITADLGFNAFEGLQAKFGKRFLNAGVAEQNMIGLAAGFALAGFAPWVYSIAPFVTYRCLEQIRNDICLHNLPVTIVGNGGGFTYGIMGSTHHALEDLAALKALPNLQLYFPCTNDQVPAAVDQIRLMRRPSYLRLGISGFNAASPCLSENSTTLTRRYAQSRTSPQWTMIGVGQGVQVLLHALVHHGLAEEDVDIFGLARFPVDLTQDAELVGSVERSRRVLVVEEHYPNGGIAESLRMALPAVEKFEVVAPTYRADQRYGSAVFHLRQCNVTPEEILRRVRRSKA